MLRTEPVTDKWAAFGWYVQRVDGNDVDALLAAFDDVAGQLHPVGAAVGPPVRHQGRLRRAAAGEPEKAHFMRIDADEWQICRDQLTAGYTESEQAMTYRSTHSRTSAMIASFADPGQKTTPAPFGHALVAAAQADDRIVGLTADLGKYTDMHIFAQAFPQRYFQMGMAEQLLFGAAAGHGRDRAGARSRRPTRCSRPAAPTTSSASTSPSRA